ncbi:FBOX [Musa troglodytarum]|uniref:FBOX n=1 Tax=Musa troglodytarum TaxID=320322 RepID=A0A9E7GNK3_9LILI|nr:FBOX [Musa troglodytarum]
MVGCTKSALRLQASSFSLSNFTKKMQSTVVSEPEEWEDLLISTSERIEWGDLLISTSERIEWGDLSIDFILMILQKLNPKDRCSAAQVCRSWRMASSDSSLDLQVVRSNFVRVDTRALGLPEALRMVVASVHENITCIVFHPSLHIHDKDLNLIAEGCPHLKRLVLPCWDLISEFAMRNAIEGWRELESMTMAGMMTVDHTIHESESWRHDEVHFLELDGYNHIADGKTRKEDADATNAAHLIMKISPDDSKKRWGDVA